MARIGIGLCVENHAQVKAHTLSLLPPLKKMESDATFWNALLSCGVAFPAGPVCSLLISGCTPRIQDFALCVRTDGDFAAECNVDSLVHASGQFHQHSVGRVSAGEGDFRDGDSPPRDAVCGPGSASLAGDCFGDQRGRSAYPDHAVAVSGAQEPACDQVCC